MDDRKHRFGTVVPKSEAEAFFRKLGEGLGNGVLAFGDTIQELGGFRNLKLSIRDMGGGYKVRLKVKPLKSGATSFEPSFFTDGDDDEDEEDERAAELADELDSPGKECHSRRK